MQRLDLRLAVEFWKQAIAKRLSALSDLNDRFRELQRAAWGRSLPFAIDGVPANAWINRIRIPTLRGPPVFAEDDHDLAKIAKL